MNPYTQKRGMKKYYWCPVKVFQSLIAVPSDFVNPSVTSISISRCEKK